MRILEVVAFLERLNLTAGVLAELRPYLGPIYSWLSAVHHRNEAAPPRYLGCS